MSATLEGRGARQVSRGAPARTRLVDHRTGERYVRLRGRDVGHLGPTACLPLTTVGVYFVSRGLDMTLAGGRQLEMRSFRGGGAGRGAVRVLITSTGACMMGDWCKMPTTVDVSGVDGGGFSTSRARSSAVVGVGAWSGGMAVMCNARYLCLLKSSPWFSRRCRGFFHHRAPGIRCRRVGGAARRGRAVDRSLGGPASLVEPGETMLQAHDRSCHIVHPTSLHQRSDATRCSISIRERRIFICRSFCPGSVLKLSTLLPL